MSIIADFTVPADAFCLGETLAALPDATVELDRLVAHSPDHVMPFVWVLNADKEAFSMAVADDSTVETATCSDSFDAAHLYQIDWTAAVNGRLQIILNHEGVILEARGAGDHWRFSVRFGTHDHFDAFRDYFEEHGQVTLHQLSSPRTPGEHQYGVSEKQREALLAAYDGGYYDIPSAISGDDLATQLGVTQQSVSRRLRRGTSTLIEHTLDRQRTA